MNNTIPFQTEKINILIIEDNLGDVQLVKMHLRDSGLKNQLFQAGTFSAGLEMVEKEHIDLTLLDLSLPDMHGFKTLTTFLERFPKIPVIVLTGSNDEVLINQAVKAGAQDYLVKGQFNSNLLARVIRYSLHRFKTHAKLEEYSRNLAISEKRFKEAQEMAQLGNWEVDLVDNRMAWSHEVFRIFEFNESSLVPSFSAYKAYIHPDDRNLVEDVFEQAGKDGKLHRVDYRIVVEGKRIKYLSNYVRVVYDSLTGKIILTGAVQDITERKVSEQLLAEKSINDGSRRIQEEVLSDLGFHIRTPLSTLSNLTYLMSKTQMSSTQEEYLNDIQISLDDLAMTANNLLNFAFLVTDKIRAERSPFEPKDLVSNISRMFQAKMIAKRLNFDTDIDDDLPAVLLADVNKLNQILFNLLDNAIKFTPNNGKIKLTVREHSHRDGVIRTSFIIRDNGKGISPKELERLQSLDESNTGMTYKEQDARKLGIPIVKKLLESLKGELFIKSEEGSGTTVEVRLPLPSVIGGKPLNVAPKSENPQRPVRILLVEDHFLNQIATKKVLMNWSDLVSVEIAENGQIALESFAHQTFDVILMDLQMPVMNGIEATEAIRQESDVPIIALTANDDIAERKTCMEKGFTDYLPKPFKPLDLYAKIMNAIS